MHAYADHLDELAFIEAERILFEADAESYGFNLQRYQCAAPEPWGEYRHSDTGHRWAGWLAARSYTNNENKS